MEAFTHHLIKLVSLVFFALSFDFKRSEPLEPKVINSFELCGNYQKADTGDCRVNAFEGVTMETTAWCARSKSMDNERVTAEAGVLRSHLLAQCAVMQAACTVTSDQPPLTLGAITHF